MKKYIINNCPAITNIPSGKIIEGFTELGFCGKADDFFNFYKCGQKNDCLLKQIVKKCREAKLPVRQWTDKDSIWEEYSPKSELAKEILDLFEIEEC